MKKITFLTLLLVSFMSFGQSSLPITFENGTTTANFQFGGIAYANIANPDMSAGNMSSRVLEVVKPAGAEWFAGFGYETPGAPFIDFANGTTFSLKIWSTKANLKLRFQVQIGLNNEPTYNRDVIVPTANTWTEVTFDFSNQAGLTGNERYSTLVIQPDYDPACEGGSCPTIAVGGTYYIDDIIQVGAADPTCTDGVQNGDETGVDCGGAQCPTCPETCTDGIQNQDETGVDCGGATCPSCPATDPTVGPNDSPSTGDDMYIYSGLSGNANQSDFPGFNLVDFNGGVTISEPVLGGNTVIRADNLDFFGSALGEVFNATATYSFVHLDYYATTSTGFNFSLVDQSLSASICCGNPEEPFYRFGVDEPLVTGEWVSVFIPLSHFADYPALVSGTWDGTDIIQTLVTGNGTVFLDNIYFSTTNVLGLDEFETTSFKVYPNPSESQWIVKSINMISNIELYDVLGKQVLNLKVDAPTVKIEAADLSKGIYFARITSNNSINTVKLIKE